MPDGSSRVPAISTALKLHGDREVLQMRELPLHKSRLGTWTIIDKELLPGNSKDKGCR